MRLKIGIVGFGLSGKVFHAGLLRENSKFEITGVVSSRKKEVVDFLPTTRVFASASELFASDVDVIVNAAPNSQHFSLSVEALKAGKHVVIEKPFVNTSVEGRELIEVAKKAGRFLTVYQNRRWDGDFLTVRDLIASGRLGTIHQFESHMDRWRPNTRSERWREQPEPGSGILFDLGAHLIDQALTLFGEPDSITADVVTQKSDGKTDDYFHLILHYGTKRVILHSSSFAPRTPRFQIYGSRGAFVKFDFDPQEPQLKQGLSIFDAVFGREPQSAYGLLQEGEAAEPVVVETKPGRYTDFYEMLFEAIKKKDSRLLPVQAQESLRVIELIEAARESSNSGQTVQL